MLAIVRGAPGPATLPAGACHGPLVALFLAFTIVNVLLAVFNMIPVPPLDGGNVLLGVLPPGRRPGGRATAAVRLPDFVCFDADRRR